jgi:hypothetical protein
MPGLAWRLHPPGPGNPPNRTDRHILASQTHDNLGDGFSPSRAARPPETLADRLARMADPPRCPKRRANPFSLATRILPAGYGNQVWRTAPIRPPHGTGCARQCQQPGGDLTQSRREEEEGETGRMPGPGRGGRSCPVGGSIRLRTPILRRLLFPRFSATLREIPSPMPEAASDPRSSEGPPYSRTIGSRSEPISRPVEPTQPFFLTEFPPTDPRRTGSAPTAHRTTPGPG